MSTVHVKLGTLTESLNTPYVEIMLMIKKYCLLVSNSYISKFFENPDSSFQKAMEKQLQ